MIKLWDKPGVLAKAHEVGRLLLWPRPNLNLGYLPAPDGLYWNYGEFTKPERIEYHDALSQTWSL